MIATAASAQADGAPTLSTVTVTDAPAASGHADVTGFGDLPLKETPISATVIGSDQIEQSGARRLSDLTQFDPSVTDSYNSPGYWDFLTIRGFTLDNRFNYRREGLPINAETSIPLDNKERVEILKGTSGIQAGTSAPGGLVNYVVKRPTEQDLRSVRIEATQRSSLLTAIDLGGRFGQDRVFGYRFNFAHERLRPLIHALDGKRDLAALALDWRIGRDSVLAAEVEWSRKTQPSQVGYSLLGNTLPAPVNPRNNLNNQPWVQPTRFEGLTGTLRFDQSIDGNWRWSAQAGTQRLKTNDYTAFPFGCSAEDVFDRFCSDGTFDYYDFRSENERRRQSAVRADLKGSVNTGSIKHDLAVGLQSARVRNRFQDQAFNYVGTGNIAGTAIVPPDPSLTDQGTDRDERSTELSLHDAIRWNERFSTWIGVRHTRLSRDSVRTDGSRPSSYDQSLTTPWIAASYAFMPGQIVYASYGEGVESQIVPNRASIYSNPGVALPALKSKQWELGVKGGQRELGWQLALFQIKRPMTNVDDCARLGIAPCQGAFDGEAVHRGVEASGQWQSGPWRLAGGASVLDAKRKGSVLDPSVNGKRPVNVPDWTLRAQAGWRVAGVPGLEFLGNVSHEGRRAVLPDDSINLPSWTRVDLGLGYSTKVRGVMTTWNVGVDNVFDKQYWKESPTQFGHVYLFPGAPRTFRVGLTAAL